MFIFQNNSIKNKYFISAAILLFFFYFLTGISIFNDYGLAFDEDIQRQIAKNNLDYVLGFFELGDKTKLTYPYYGVGFELPALLIENLFQLDNSRDTYFLRHLTIFLVSFVGSIFFFLIIQKRFKILILSILGTIILISTPRIFAESFYNSKDIVFMNMFLISCYFGINFIDNPKIKNILFFSFFSALTINVRVIGIIIPVIFTFFFLIKFLRNDYKISFLKVFFLFLSSLILFSIAMWPALWISPLDSFINAFQTFKSYEIELTNFYFGQYVSAKNLHWYYIPIWILVTTPIYIIILFVVVFFLKILRIAKRIIKIENDNSYNDLWRSKLELYDLIFFSIIFISIFSVILFNSTLYTGWRHLYFIYPFLIIFSIHAIKNISIYFKKNLKIRIIFSLCLIVSILHNFFWIYKNHPHQNVYFNFLAGPKPHLNYEIDYWGLSNRYALEYIGKNDERAQIKVSNISDTSLLLNFSILNKQNKERLLYSTSILNSDYLIDNNYFFNSNNKKRRKNMNNFDLYYQLYVDEILVTTIYRKKS